MAPVQKTQRHPTANTCIECGRCDQACPMNIAVMQYIKAKVPVAAAECVLCGACAKSCPVRAIQ